MKPTLATRARKPCQSGNAYPGWSPPSANSSTEASDRSPRSRSFRARARWKRPSPPISPATCHSSSPRITPADPDGAASRDGRHGRPAERERRRDDGGGAEQDEGEAERGMDGEDDPERAEHEAQPPREGRETLHARPAARATIAPGASTSPVARTSRTSRNAVLIARAARRTSPVPSQRAASRYIAPCCPRTSLPAEDERRWSSDRTRSASSAP